MRHCRRSLAVAVAPGAVGSALGLLHIALRWSSGKPGARIDKRSRRAPAIDQMLSSTKSPDGLHQRVSIGPAFNLFGGCRWIGRWRAFRLDVDVRECGLSGLYPPVGR